MNIREAVVKKASFAASHPEILERVQCLTVANDLHPVADSDLLDKMGVYEAYHEPLYAILHVILSQAKGLREVKFVFLPLPLKLYEAIMTLPNLHTLRLMACSADYKTAEPRPLASSSTVTNFFVGVSDIDIWWLVPNIPNIRTMSLISETYRDSLLPPPKYINTINPFQNLEKLYVFDLPGQDIPGLIGWVKTANQNIPLPLTHLKLSGKRPFSPEILHDILSVFGTPTMQYLSLRAVADAPPSLLKHLAKAFPNLISLTLILSRHRNSATASVVWPHPLADYATMLSEFNCLRYFRWNQAIGSPGSKTIGEWKRVFEDLRDNAKVFATEVPSLEYIDFLEGREPNLGLLARRDDSGEASFDMDIGSSRLDPNLHDPSLSPRNTWWLI